MCEDRQNLPLYGYIWCSFCRLIRRPEHLIGNTGISWQTEGHLFGERPISVPVSVTLSSMIEASVMGAHQITWQEQDQNILSQDLNQPVEFHLELPRRRSGNGWTKNIKQRKYLTGLKQAKELIVAPSANRSKDLPKLNRDQLRRIVRLLTGHCLLKGHLIKLDLTFDPICEKCLEEDESATHVLRDCEAIGHLDQFFMEPGDYYDAPISRVLQFVRSAGLLKD
jgi:hypothetical protein